MGTRPATANDIADIAAVYVRAWRAGYEGLLDPRRLEAEAVKRAGYDWLGAIVRSGSIVVVAEFDHEIVGVIECEHDPPLGRAAEVHMLYVSPSAWGTGAATVLLDEAVARARRAGQRAMWLDVVEVQGRARRFYEREGWQLDETAAPKTNGLFPLLRYRRKL